MWARQGSGRCLKPAVSIQCFPILLVLWNTGEEKIAEEFDTTTFVEDCACDASARSRMQGSWRVARKEAWIRVKKREQMSQLASTAKQCAKEYREELERAPMEKCVSSRMLDRGEKVSIIDSSDSRDCTTSIWDCHRCWRRVCYCTFAWLWFLWTWKTLHRRGWPCLELGRQFYGLQIRCN